MNIKSGIKIALSITALVTFSMLKTKKKLGPCSQELEEIINRKG